MSKKEKSNSVAQFQDALSMLRELDRALAMHLNWLKGIHRILICEMEPDPADLSVDAHCHCCFGHWYYAVPEAVRLGMPVLADVEAPHQAMHGVARDLLLAHGRGRSINSDDYERFMDLAMAFKATLIQCQNYIIGQVCTVDQLTGIWNRQSMNIRLSEEFERARRVHAPVCICLLDIDHFKKINDQYGHISGDLVLQALSRFLKGEIRPYDSLFRYGGEEFLFCLPNTQLDEAEQLLNRLRKALEGLDIAICEGQSVRMTASFGVALANTEESIDKSIESADHALLFAKANGRNRVCVWDI
jgi:diguanylate cyclase (GGDEF)-like protein